MLYNTHLEDTPKFSSLDIARMRQNLEKSKTFHNLTKNIQLIAHRGMGPTSLLGSTFESAIPPENTLRSFKQAMMNGADGIELDIFLSKDKEVMVIHDNELWRNVYDVDRSGNQLPDGETQESFDVSKKTKYQLQQLELGSKGEKIPTISEVFELAKNANVIRAKQNLPPIIINIEIKDSKAVTQCLDQISDYMKNNPNSGVDFKSITFCSFDHEALIELKKQAHKKNPRIAPAIRTTLLFGDENVDKKNGFKVKPGAKYQEQGLKHLRELVVKNGFSGYDGILWDIYEPLAKMAALDEKELHASTSDFREYEEYLSENTSFIEHMIEMSKVVPTLMFKCDNVDSAMKLFIQAKIRENSVDRRLDEVFLNERQGLLATLLIKPGAYSKTRQSPMVSESERLLKSGFSTIALYALSDDKLATMLNNVASVELLVEKGLIRNDLTNMDLSKMQLCIKNASRMGHMLDCGYESSEIFYLSENRLKVVLREVGNLKSLLNGGFSKYDIDSMDMNKLTLFLKQAKSIKPLRSAGFSKLDLTYMSEDKLAVLLEYATSVATLNDVGFSCVDLEYMGREKLEVLCANANKVATLKKGGVDTYAIESMSASMLRNACASADGRLKLMEHGVSAFDLNYMDNARCTKLCQNADAAILLMKSGVDVDDLTQMPAENLTLCLENPELVGKLVENGHLTCFDLKYSEADKVSQIMEIQFKLLVKRDVDSDEEDPDQRNLPGLNL